jgi:hypothetical protein
MASRQIKFSSHGWWYYCWNSEFKLRCDPETKKVEFCKKFRVDEDDCPISIKNIFLEFISDPFFEIERRKFYEH